MNVNVNGNACGGYKMLKWAGPALFTFVTLLVAALFWWIL